jgi:hypothetical protein
MIARDVPGILAALAALILTAGVWLAEDAEPLDFWLARLTGKAAEVQLAWYR